MIWNDSAQKWQRPYSWEVLNKGSDQRECPKEQPMTSDEPLKTCARCKRAKPRFSGYRRHAGYGDGWESRCKSCQRETERLRKLQKKSGAGHEPSAAELLELAEGESLYAKRVIKALTDANKAVAALLVAIADVPGSGAGAR